MPRRPRTLEHLYGRLPRVTSALFGVHSHLREVDDSESPGPFQLAAFGFPGGDLELRPSAARRLQRLIEGAPVTTPGLRRLIVTDLLTLLHESIHALGPDDPAAMRQAFGSGRDDAERAVSEGLVEWAAWQHLPDFIRALGLDARDPWLLTTTPVAAYEGPAATIGVVVAHVAVLRHRSLTDQTAELLRSGVPHGALELLSRQWAAALGSPERARDVETAILGAMRSLLAHAAPAEAARIAARQFARSVDGRVASPEVERGVA
jgi:hypothetical protein